AAPAPAEPPAEAEAEPAAAPAAPKAAPAEGNGNGHNGDGRPFVSPVVARMVAEHGLDVSAIPGTGRGGRVTKKDVPQFIDSGGAAAPAQAPEVHDVPHFVPPRVCGGQRRATHHTPPRPPGPRSRPPRPRRRRPRRPLPRRRQSRSPPR